MLSRHDSAYMEYFRKTPRFIPKLSLYKASNSQNSIDINVTLSCSTVESGCGHITCPAPPGSSPGPYQSFSMSGLLGDGCKPWTASGSMKIWNDLTRANAAWSAAIAAYGNPYDTGMYLP